MRYISYITIAIFTAIVYFSVAVLLLNITLVQETFANTIPFATKVTILSALVFGSWQSLAKPDFFLLVSTALLVGANSALSVRLLQRLQTIGKVSFVAGSGTMLGFISVGCASCGLSVLSLFGLSGALALIPFGNMTLYILAIVLLTISLWYNIHQLHKPLVCKK